MIIFRISYFLPRTESQAALLNREGMIYARGHLKLTEISQQCLALAIKRVVFLGKPRLTFALVSLLNMFNCV